MDPDPVLFDLKKDPGSEMIFFPGSRISDFEHDS
jgi:hypothetical protein